MLLLCCAMLLADSSLVEASNSQRARPLASLFCIQELYQAVGPSNSSPLRFRSSYWLCSLLSRSRLTCEQKGGIVSRN